MNHAFKQFFKVTGFSITHFFQHKTNIILSFSYILSVFHSCLLYHVNVTNSSFLSIFSQREITNTGYSINSIILHVHLWNSLREKKLHRCLNAFTAITNAKGRHSFQYHSDLINGTRWVRKSFTTTRMRLGEHNTRVIRFSTTLLNQVCKIESHRERVTIRLPFL